MDVTEEAALLRLAPHDRDACVCAIGDEAREASFICTALLRQMGAPRIIARATDRIHERILRMIGAHQIVNPESEFGQRIATNIAHDGLLGEYNLKGDAVIAEIKAPATFIGKSLAELDLRKRFGISVIALQRDDTTIIAVDPLARLAQGDVMVVVGKRGSAAKIAEQEG